MSFSAQEILDDLREEQATQLNQYNQNDQDDSYYDDESQSVDEVSSDSSFNDISQLESMSHRPLGINGRSTLSIFSGHASDIQNQIVNINTCLPLISNGVSPSPFWFSFHHGRSKYPIERRRKKLNLLDTLPMEEDIPSYKEIQVYRGGKHINTLPEDAIISILSYLPLSDLKSSSEVCTLWYQLHKHNIIWERWLRAENGGSLQYSIVSANGVSSENISILKAYYRKYKKKKQMKRKRQQKEQRKKMNQIKKLKSKSYSELQDLSQIENPSHHDKISKKNENTLYFRTYRKILRDKKRVKKIKKKMVKNEKLKKHYEHLFHKPQKLAEVFLCIYNSLLLIVNLFTMIVFSLYLDKIFDIPNAEKWTLLIILSPLIVMDIGYLFAIICAVAAELLSSFRRNKNYSGLISMVYLGNAWYPLTHIIVIFKLYFLPESTPWRVSFAPLWVLCCIYSITSIILGKQIPYLKWETDQKVMWVATSLLNTVVTFTTAFLATILDLDNFRDSIRHVYSVFVFSPIWVLLISALIAIPIFGYAFLNEFGFIFTMLVYAPATLLFVVPFLPFFIMLALKMDGMITFPYTVIFSPIMFWEVYVFIALVFIFIIKKGTGLIP